MKQKLVDAQTMLGFALTCLGFAAYFAYDYWWTKRKLSEATRAKLILDDVPSKREQLLAEEGVEHA